MQDFIGLEICRDLSEGIIGVSGAIELACAGGEIQYDSNSNSSSVFILSNFSCEQVVRTDTICIDVRFEPLASHSLHMKVIASERTLQSARRHFHTRIIIAFQA